MFIYTSHNGGERARKMRDRGMGVMLHSCTSKMPSKNASGFRCALDNGAFGCWQRGYPFQSDVFITAIKKAYSAGISLDFIVCPDIVAGGVKSLNFSMKWALEELESAPRLALVVQDGMTPRDLSPGYHLKPFTHIFIGGTPEWKWRTAKDWVDYAHNQKKLCHIGQVGTLEKLRAAKRMGADSVDSTNFARNDSWAVIDEFMDGKQHELDIED